MKVKTIINPVQSAAALTHRVWWLLLIGFALTVAAKAQEREAPLRITVERPGTLAEQVGEARKYTVRALAVEGPLDGSDLRYLREMAGSDYRQQPTPGRLRHADLSRATYVRGGEPYILKDTAVSVTGGAHTLPAFLFRNCRIETVDLPARMDTIGTGAFEYSRLRNIRLPEDVVLGDWVFNRCDSLADVTFPRHLVELPQNVFRDCGKLRRVRMHDVQYIAWHAFEDVGGLEEISIDGTLWHVDGWFCHACPRLRRIEFSGNVLSTGGSPIASQCPQLEEITFSGFCLPMGFGSVEDCPKVKRCRVTGCVTASADTTFIPSAKDFSEKDAALLRRAAEAAMQFFADKHPESRYTRNRLIFSRGLLGLALQRRETALALEMLRFMRDNDMGHCLNYMNLKAIDLPGDNKEYAELMQELREQADYRRILRTSPPYDTGSVYRTSAPCAPMEYAAANDSTLQRIRQYFKADYIAGTGDEVERIKNVMYWVHDRIRHRGDFMPQGRRSAVELFEGCRKAVSPGMNARGQAIVLAELYQSLGWPARFITCQPKYYKDDRDCTVVTVVWSYSLKKWVMMDASFAAYVTDENGLLLHPGEIRQRMRDGRKAVLNGNANWNFQNPVTPEFYLDKYMAKNLYYLSGYRNSYPGIESESNGEYYTLTPEGEEPYIGKTTHDDAWFWQNPL